MSFIVSLCAIFAHAQDVIVFRNGEETEVKVEEVSPTEVKYKKYSNIDGPLYVADKSEIFMIKYKNGEKDVFDSVTPAQPTQTQTKSVVIKDVKVTRKSPSGLRYTSDGSFMMEQDAMNYLGSDYNEFSAQAHRMKGGFKLLLSGAILSVASPILIGVGFALGDYDSSSSYSNGNYYYYAGDTYNPNYPILLTGVACGIASSVMIPVGAVRFATGKTKCHRILKSHYPTAWDNETKNSSYDQLTLKVNAKPNGLSLSLNF